MSGWGLRAKSAKRQAEEQARRDLVRRVRDRDRTCRARDLAPGRCSGPLDVHEVIPRSAWRAGYLVDDNCLLVCREHHDWIGDFPDSAHGFGLHGYSWEVRDGKS